MTRWLDVRTRLSALRMLFCVASATRPGVPLVQGPIAAIPLSWRELLIGHERVSDNPKLNNCSRAGARPTIDWIIIADSNVLMPRDYIQRLFASWRRRYRPGLLAAGRLPAEGFWAELECAFLNTYQARWQYLVDSLRLGFAQGKTMLWRRTDLERAGGIERWPRKSPKTPPRPRSCATPACRCAWSIGRWPSRSDIAAQPKSGAGKFAGRGCGAPASCSISCRRFLRRDFADVAAAFRARSGSPVTPA